MSQSWPALLKEVEELHAFIEAQKAILSKENLASLLTAHCSQITTRTISCSPAEAAVFTSLVSKGPWHDDHKLQLATWSSEQLLNSSPGTRPRRRESQKCGSFCNYLSNTDCAILADESANLTTKLDCSLIALDDTLLFHVEYMLMFV